MDADAIWRLCLGAEDFPTSRGLELLDLMTVNVSAARRSCRTYRIYRIYRVWRWPSSIYRGLTSSELIAIDWKPRRVDLFTEHKLKTVQE